MDIHLPRAVTGRSVRLAVAALSLVAVVVAVTSCATAPKKRQRVAGPFTRAVLLFYEFGKLNPDPDSIQSSDAMDWLTVERGMPKTVTAVPFDQDDRWLYLDRRPSLWVWKSSDNVQIQRTEDGPTARVTLTGGDTGWLKVSSAGYAGDIKVLRQGYRSRP